MDSVRTLEATSVQEESPGSFATKIQPLCYRGDLQGDSCSIRYIFADDSTLLRGVYDLEYSIGYAGFLDASDTFRKLKQLLTGKYGEPLLVETRGFPKVVWETERTHIEMLLIAFGNSLKDGSNTILLSYDSLLGTESELKGL